MPRRDLRARRPCVHIDRRDRSRKGGRTPPSSRPRDRPHGGLHPDRVRRQEDGHDTPRFQREPHGRDRVHQVPSDGHRQAWRAAPREACRAHRHRHLLAVLQGPRQGHPERRGPRARGCRHLRIKDTPVPRRRHTRCRDGRAGLQGGREAGCPGLLLQGPR